MAAAAAALLGLTNYDSPLLRSTMPALITSFAINGVFGIPSTLMSNPPTEVYYDLAGAIANATAAILSLCLPRLRAQSLLATASNGSALTIEAPHWRQLALTGCVLIWTARLGTYLVRRMHRDGKDTRFDDFRTDYVKLAFAWTAQALWVLLIQSPVTAVNAVGAPILLAGSKHPVSTSVLPNGALWTDVVGFGLWAFGFVFESVADYQKDTWTVAKQKKGHDEVFLSKGLFSLSRYPHYFGETTLWAGLALVGAGVLVQEPVRAALGGISVATAVAICAISPAFTAYVLLRVSGAPLSERKYDRKYGKRADYQKWKRETPKFFPKFF